MQRQSQSHFTSVVHLRSSAIEISSKWKNWYSLSFSCLLQVFSRVWKCWPYILGWKLANLFPFDKNLFVGQLGEPCTTTGGKNGIKKFHKHCPELASTAKYDNDTIKSFPGLSEEVVCCPELSAFDYKSQRGGASGKCVPRHECKKYLRLFMKLPVLKRRNKS